MNYSTSQRQLHIYLFVYLGTILEKRGIARENVVEVEGAQSPLNFFLVEECFCNTKTAICFESIACLFMWIWAAYLWQGTRQSEKRAFWGRYEQTRLTWFLASLEGFGYRRPGDFILLCPLFLLPLTLLSSWWKTILSRDNIADTYKLAESVESWKGPKGSVVVFLCQMTWNVRRSVTSLLLRETGIQCCMKRIIRLKPGYSPQDRVHVGLRSMLFRFRCLGHY